MSRRTAAGGTDCASIGVSRNRIRRKGQTTMPLNHLLPGRPRSGRRAAPGTRAPAGQRRAHRVGELHVAAPSWRRWAACSRTSTPKATPRKRYYGGCEKVDIVEDLARERACQLFGANFANVQPHSGANANFGAYTGAAASWATRCSA